MAPLRPLAHALLAAAAVLLCAGQAGAASPGAADASPMALAGPSASTDVRRVADWALAIRDNQGLPFAIIDKKAAAVFIFGADGRLRGASPVLLGRAIGDDTVPGIGERKLHSILPEERTTPAGRFLAAPGRDLERDVLWVDYDNAISMHRVVHGDPDDRRLERLASPSPAERRISYGCINVPVKFYDEVIAPTLGTSASVVYILPEVKSLVQVFGLADGELAAASR